MNQWAHNTTDLLERRIVLMRSTVAGWEYPRHIWQLSNTVTEEQWDFQMNANQIKPKLELHACILMLWI